MDKNLKINNFIVHTGWFDNQFMDWTQPERAEIKEFQTSLRLKQFPVGKTSISYRTVNHWEEMGLLFEDTERNEGWRKFSLVELVWLHIIKELREYGMSLEALKKVKEAITFPDKKHQFLLLEMYIGALTKDSFLIVSKDGLSGLGIAEEIEMTQQLRPFPKSYITISINSMLKKAMTGKDVLVMRKTFLAPMDTDVNKILHSVMFENAKEIKMTTKDNQIHKVEIKKEHMNPEQAFETLRKLTKDGKRKRISLEVQDGKIIAIEETEKTKRKAD